MQEPKTKNENDIQSFYDERTRQKIDKHLKDINDEITEEDIKNVSTDFSAGNFSTETLKEKESPASGEKRKKDKSNEHFPNSYDILDS